MKEQKLLRIPIDCSCNDIDITVKNNQLTQFLAKGWNIAQISAIQSNGGQVDICYVLIERETNGLSKKQ